MSALAGALFLFAGLLGAADAAAAELFHAVDAQNRLVTFRSDATTSIVRTPISGLAAGEQIVGLDRRPANGQIIGLGSTSRLYRVDAATGAATAVSPTPFVPALNGSTFGFDFNPTVDRIRLTSDNRQDLRLNPDTGQTAAVDGTLTYAASDPGAGSSPQIVASAYTNSVAGATTTQLFNLDASRNTLVLQNPPNNGTLVTIGALGVDINNLAGFDISGVDGVAYAALRTPGPVASQLYTINLATGAATLVGRIGGRSALRALTAAGTAPADTSAPEAAIIRLNAPSRVDALLRRGVRLRATSSEGGTLSAEIRSGGRVVGGGKSVVTDLAGSAPLRLVFSGSAKREFSGRESVEFTVVVTARDAAGNTSTSTRTIRARG